MDASGSLREGDVAAMLRLVDEARHDDPGEVFPWALFYGIRSLVPCDVDVGFISNDYRDHWSPVHQLLDEDGRPFVEVVPRKADQDPAEAEDFWALFWDSSCSYPQRTGDLRNVVTTTDFYPVGSGRHDPIHEVLPDIRHYMCVSFPEVVPGAYRRIVLRRGEDTPFTETLALPHRPAPGALGTGASSSR